MGIVGGEDIEFLTAISGGVAFFTIICLSQIIYIHFFCDGEPIGSHRKKRFFGSLVSLCILLGIRDSFEGFALESMLQHVGVAAFFVFISTFVSNLYLEKIRKQPENPFLGKICGASFLIMIAMFAISSSDAVQEPKRIASMNTEERQLYNTKFAEYAKSMDEDDARTKAIADVDAYVAANEKLAAMNDEEKALYDQKFAEYTHTMDDISARTKAVEDVETDTAAKKKALQEMYDKQKQYEEWLAQKKEQEEKALAEKKILERRNEQKYWLLSPDGFKATNYHVEDEVWVCDWISKRNDADHIGDQQNVDGNIYAVYYLPSSKKYEEHGVVFKDPGYKVDVIEKIGGKPVHWFTLQFWKNDDKWKYRIFTRRDISNISQWLKPEDFDLSKTINYFEIGESIYQYDRFPGYGYDQPWGDIVEDEHLKLLVREKFIETGIDAATVDKYIENMSEDNWIKCVFYATHTIADDVKK